MVALGECYVSDATEYCTYSSVKLDAALVSRARWAAAKAGKSIQEWLSDVVNDVSARELREKSIKRLPPRPRKKQGRDA